MADQPQTVGQLLGRRDAAVRRQETSSALPLRTFPHRARRRCAAAHGPRRTHRQGGDSGGRTATSTDRGFALREDGTYLVTGGPGRLGPESGPLAGRSRAPGTWSWWGGPRRRSEARSQIEDLEKAGVQRRRPPLRRGQSRSRWPACCPTSAEGLPPLRGIFHLAGVLDDGVLREQTRERFDRVMAAKSARAPGTCTS